MTSQGVVLATAMAVSGTVILLALHLHKSFPTPHFSLNTIPPSPSPRSCISSDRKERRKKAKKRVQFAEDVVEPRGNGEEYRKLHSNKCDHEISWASDSPPFEDSNEKAEGRMPANRLALYNGILRDRVLHRMAYSY